MQGSLECSLKQAPRPFCRKVSCTAVAIKQGKPAAGDEEARARGTQKSVLERKAPPTFPLVIEMRERAYWVTHWVEDSVDCLLHAKVPVVQVRTGLQPLHNTVLSALCPLNKCQA